MPTTPRRAALWEAVNEYARACGGDTGIKTTGDWRMEAVVKVERAADCDTFDELVAALRHIRDYARDSRTGRMLTHEGYEMADTVLKKAEEQRT